MQCINCPYHPPHITNDSQCCTTHQWALVFGTGNSPLGQLARRGPGCRTRILRSGGRSTWPSSSSSSPLDNPHECGHLKSWMPYVWSQWEKYSVINKNKVTIKTLTKQTNKLFGKTNWNLIIITCIYSGCQYLTVQLLNLLHDLRTLYLSSSIWLGMSPASERSECCMACHQKLSSWFRILSMSPFRNVIPASWEGISRSWRGL